MQNGKSAYNSFDPEYKEQPQTALEALLRVKLLSNDHNERKEDCAEGAMCSQVYVDQFVYYHSLYAVLLKLAEGCSESDTHLMLGYLLSITKVL